MTPSSSANALTPGPSRRYVAQSVPTFDAISASAGLSSPACGRKSTVRKLYSTAPDSHCSLVTAAWKS